MKHVHERSCLQELAHGRVAHGQKETPAVEHDGGVHHESGGHDLARLGQVAESPEVLLQQLAEAHALVRPADPPRIRRSHLLQSVDLLEMVPEEDHVPLHVHAHGQLAGEGLQHVPLRRLVCVGACVDHVRVDVAEDVAKLCRDLSVLLDDRGAVLLFRLLHLHRACQAEALHQLALDLVRGDRDALPAVAELGDVLLPVPAARLRALRLAVVVVVGFAQVVLALADHGRQLLRLCLEHRADFLLRCEGKALAEAAAELELGERLGPLLLLQEPRALQERGVGFCLQLRALVRMDFADRLQRLRPPDGLRQPPDRVVPPLRVQRRGGRVVGLQLHGIAPRPLRVHEQDLEEARVVEVRREGHLLVAAAAVLEFEHNVEAPQAALAVLPVAQVVVVPKTV
mmetsp:Transcript_35579/g.96478  ORF Transcript_35579/g.96478 Transcript_35579/m.96478 type:complete len:399 (+) Transcript_35579:476-1672(+)